MNIDAEGRTDGIVRPNLDLSGEWRATNASDDTLRTSVGLDTDDSEWTTIAVPGHWQAHPGFARSNGPLLYRREFSLPAPAEGERRFVVVDGIFYQGDVWLDGAYLGDPEGYFVPHAYDVTALSRLDEEHVLAIGATCSPQRDKKNKRNITGVFQHWDCIDPDLNPGGIWRGVRIESTGPVRIDALRVLCRDASESRANLRLHARLECDVERPVKVSTWIDGVLSDEQQRTMAGGTNEIEWDVDVRQPALWWPWSLGAQNLTDVRVEVSCDGVTSHAVDRRTGLREVAVRDWVYTLNGERLFIKGANLAPTRALLGVATTAELRRDVELARDAGLDLLRVHGHISRSELYDAADELGMLIWQDFPLQWGYARQIRRQAVRQATE
ncbi:MAG: glycoside hydrolase family 2 protein, partial [Acidimicrobiia bacterium]